MRRCWRTPILAAAAMLLSAAAVLAQQPTKVIYGLSIPDRIGSLVYKETVDFESKSSGLGYALRFLGRPDWQVDVYLYDMQLKAIPADVGSPVLKDQLTQAKGDVFALGKRGTYANVSEKGDFAIPESGKPRFMCRGQGAVFNFRSISAAALLQEKKRNTALGSRQLKLLLPFQRPPDK